MEPTVYMVENLQLSGLLTQHAHFWYDTSTVYSPNCQWECSGGRKIRNIYEIGKDCQKKGKIGIIMWWLDLDVSTRRNKYSLSAFYFYTEHGQDMSQQS